MLKAKKILENNKLQATFRESDGQITVNVEPDLISIYDGIDFLSISPSSFIKIKKWLEKNEVI